jgi:hypothetical protein
MNFPRWESSMETMHKWAYLIKNLNSAYNEKERFVLLKIMYPFDIFV